MTAIAIFTPIAMVKDWVGILHIYLFNILIFPYFLAYLPHPQLSQSVFTVFYDEMRMHYIPNFNELTDT
jgi:hypothetical protein